jgi:hypothetical protein
MNLSSAYAWKTGFNPCIANVANHFTLRLDGDEICMPSQSFIALKASADTFYPVASNQFMAGEQGVNAAPDPIVRRCVCGGIIKEMRLFMVLLLH